MFSPRSLGICRFAASLSAVGTLSELSNAAGTKQGWPHSFDKTKIVDSVL